MATDTYEAWRDALAAFYRAEAWFVSAENVGKLRMPLTEADRRTIDALKAASAIAPEYRRAA
jgi:hypothetical protein